MKDLDKFRMKLPAPRGRRLLGTSQPQSLPGTHGRTLAEIVEQYTARGPVARSLLLFDATGSMAPYWQHVRTTLDEMLARFLSLGDQAELKIVAYRDDCDGARAVEQSAWSGDIGCLQGFVGAIQCLGGGDRPEAIDCALQLAVQERGFVSGVVLLGDAPPHEGQRDGRDRARALARLRRPVYPIVVGGAADTRQAFDQIARISGGKLVALDRLDDLYDVLGVVFAHSAGADELNGYVTRYGRLLTRGGREAVRLLTDGSE